MQYVIYVLILLALIIIVRNIRVVQQSKVMIIERLWQISGHLGHRHPCQDPFFERVAKDHLPQGAGRGLSHQPVITKDNVTMQIDTVIYFQITDPKLYYTALSTPWSLSRICRQPRCVISSAISSLTSALPAATFINGKKCAPSLTRATDPWGIKVNRVELKNILPPRRSSRRWKSR